MRLFLSNEIGCRLLARSNLYELQNCMTWKKEVSESKPAAAFVEKVAPSCLSVQVMPLLCPIVVVV